MLRANDLTSDSSWEEYTLCIDNTTNLLTIQANANGLYVSTELGYTGSSYAVLRARASGVGLWEKYYLFQTWDGTTKVYSIQSKANGLYVAAELAYWGNGYGMLRARTAPNSIDSWEEFIINAA